MGRAPVTHVALADGVPASFECGEGWIGDDLRGAFAGWGDDAEGAGDGLFVGVHARDEIGGWGQTLHARGEVGGGDGGANIIAVGW